MPSITKKHNPRNPQRGEVWSVNFEPATGCEMQKKRPAVVISSDFLGKLPLKIVVPITEWKETYAKRNWHVRIQRNAANGLVKDSSADALQVRAVTTERFCKKYGILAPAQLEEITLAVAVLIELK